MVFAEKGEVERIKTPNKRRDREIGESVDRASSKKTTYDVMTQRPQRDPLALALTQES